MGLSRAWTKARILLCRRCAGRGPRADSHDANLRLIRRRRASAKTLPPWPGRSAADWTASPSTRLCRPLTATLADAFYDRRLVSRKRTFRPVAGVILMALANKGGAMVLATGNKSEMATGYATCRNWQSVMPPLKDILLSVYHLARCGGALSRRQARITRRGYS